MDTTSIAIGEGVLPMLLIVVLGILREGDMRPGIVEQGRKVEMGRTRIRCWIRK